MNETLLHRVAAAIQPLGKDVVLVGGAAHALFRRHPRASPPGFPVLHTEDIDIAASRDLGKTGVRHLFAVRVPG